MTINPAALKALADGDAGNFLVASTPGGIEAQEMAGQAALVASTNMPKEMRPSREAFEMLGFVFGEDVDDLFIAAKLPAGWTRGATSHSMHSDVLDGLGHRRVGVFYKAAFYDRRASAHLVPRFSIEDKYPHEQQIKADTLIPVIVTDAGVEIYRAGEAKYFDDWKARDQLDKKAEAWLDDNRPGWRDLVESWKI